ncbi:MAG: hypothetical protein VB144_11625 [Clostridia bacterium]|nr:hypothetical protein [Clostridia bacterium]
MIEVSADDMAVLEKYHRARAARYATLTFEIQDGWPVGGDIKEKFKIPPKGGAA